MAAPRAGTRDYDGDLAGFRFLNLVRDAIGVVFALGPSHRSRPSSATISAPRVAAYAALVRPDIFKRMVLMSAPFGGPPVPFDAASRRGQGARHPCRPRGAAAAAQALPVVLLDPAANDNMWKAPQGVHDFLRAYYHHKSADWKANKPFELKGWTAEELAKMPTYYIMDLADGMAETVAKEMPSAGEIAANTWLTEDELKVYSGEYERNGFQGGLHWYRVRTTGRFNGELEVFAGRTVDVPSTFISGRSDWGIYQSPGRARAHAEDRLHQHEGDPPHRGRRPLGPAGAARRGEPPAASVPEVELSRGT